MNVQKAIIESPIRKSIKNSTQDSNRPPAPAPMKVQDDNGILHIDIVVTLTENGKRFLAEEGITLKPYVKS